jgi:hypothetical protein
MKPRFARSAALRSRARRASTLSLFLALFASGAAHAEGTPGQREVCTPDVYRIRDGEIPDTRAITSSFRRQKVSPGEACRAVFGP